MNLNALVAPMTRTITPGVPATLMLSTGSVKSADYSRDPTYAREPVTADFQAASPRDLKQLDALNIQNVERVAYLNGNVEGINRIRGKGGDLVYVPAGAHTPASSVGTWLVAAVLETWDTPGWCKVGLVLQVVAP